MKYKLIFFTSLFFGIINCSCSQNVECKDGINLLPMYGRVEKCKNQLEADSEFLALSDKQEPDRAKAAIEMMNTSWYYLHQGNYGMAMKRMNQAWLLDSTNVAIYASFAVILDLTNKSDDAIKMLDLTFNKIGSRKDPENSNPTDSPSNEIFIEFIVANTPFAYKKTNNLNVPKYLYNKLGALNISESKKKALKDELKDKIPEID